MFYKIQIKLIASENCFHAQTALQAVRLQNHNGSYHILHLNHVGIEPHAGVQSDPNYLLKRSGMVVSVLQNT